MKSINQNAPVIIISAIIIALLGIFFWLDSQKKLNWEESYKIKDEQPYGGFVLAQLLETLFEDTDFTEIKKPLHKVLEMPESGKKANYVFVGNKMFLSPKSGDTLLSFVAKGNDAFIIAETLPTKLKQLFSKETDSLGFGFYDNSPSMQVALDFTHPTLTTPFEARFYHPDTAMMYYWFFLDEKKEVENPYTPLGTMNDNKTVFFKMPYKKGNFYFHTLPLTFSNFTLKKEEGLEYVQKVFSHLEKGDIYWDSYSQVFAIGEGGGRGKSHSAGPLGYILSKKTLRWAWYLGLVLVFMYVLFKAKRQQKVIPVLESYKNTSLEFVQTIGKLYFQQQDHRKLGLQKMTLFLADLRTKYHIHTNNIDERMIQELSEKSQVPQKEVQQIFKRYEKLEKFYKINEGDLERFYLSVERFYEKCK